jgi:hypothetical protein
MKSPKDSASHGYVVLKIKESFVIDAHFKFDSITSLPQFSFSIYKLTEYLLPQPPVTPVTNIHIDTLYGSVNGNVDSVTVNNNPTNNEPSQTDDYGKDRS